VNAEPWPPGGRRLLPALVGAIVLNLVLLIAVTVLSRNQPVERSEEFSTPIHLIRMATPKTEDQPRREPPKPPEPKPPPLFEPELFRPIPGLVEPPDVGVAVDLDRLDLPTDERFVFRMDEVDQPAQPVFRKEPVYPERALRLLIEGRVKVQFLVASDGRARDIEILSASPKGTFEESVLQAVASWRFKPGFVDGHPVDSWWSTEITFKVER